MKVVRETTVAGRTIFRSLKYIAGNHTRARAKRTTITSEAVRKNNDRMAVKNLWLLLNANFDDETGAHVTLTYREGVDQEQAAKDRKKFISKLRKEMKRRGTELKYVAVTEYLNARIHHHMVVNTQDAELIRAVWGQGEIIRLTPLHTKGDYHDLAEYLVKETAKTFRDPESAHKHRYSPSRNLTRPVTKKEYVDAQEMKRDPEALTGYYIPKERERRFEHPVTHIEHLEYLMVALDKPRKYKVWPRGVVTAMRERYRADEEVQEDLFDLL